MAEKKALIWNEEFETMPRPELEKLQLERLKKVVAYCMERVPFYRELYTQAGVSADDIQSLEDIAKLPFTNKQDLRERYPFGMFAVPVSELKQIHATSGTTGKMTVTGYTANDMEVWGETMARVYTAGGVTADDVIHNAYGYGLFTGGLGFHIGAEKIGATVIPVSGGLTRRQIEIMQDFGSTVLNCTPSYALVLAEEAAAMGVDLRRDTKLRVGFFGAEPWTDRMREEIEEKIGLEAYDIYGLAEIIGPGVSVECPYHNGLHIAEDHFYPEIIDPDTGDPLGYDQWGELVFTTLTKEGLPLIRYRTRDRTRLHVEKCACGRTMVRMEKVLGRTDDMLIVRGVNVFPSQVEHVLLQFEELEPQYVIYVDREKDRLDTLEVWVEASQPLYARGEEAVKEVEERVKKAMRETLYISTAVKVTEPGSIERSMGKARRVVDRRELG
ncbi:MAG TPA: phenylacetate--CoA ligase [Anaerolineae bacterium]|nr:phenylacetate--CoA ligase [Anaerolineae bacterium]